MDYKLSKRKKKGRCSVLFCRNPSRGTLCQKHYMRKWRAEHPRRAAFNSIRDRARRRKIPFTLTFEEFCDAIAGTGYADGKGRHRECLHLDRIRDELGYVPGNIQVLKMEENVAKSNRERHLPEKRRYYATRKGLGRDEKYNSGGEGDIDPELCPF